MYFFASPFKEFTRWDAHSVSGPATFCMRFWKFFLKPAYCVIFPAKCGSGTVGAFAMLCTALTMLASCVFISDGGACVGAGASASMNNWRLMRSVSKDAKVAFRGVPILSDRHIGTGLPAFFWYLVLGIGPEKILQNIGG